MKQSEIEKAIRQANKEVCRKYYWKSSRGFLFKKIDQLFFVLIITGQGKAERIYFTLNYKLLEFDYLFWRIAGMEEHMKQPLSFHAAGVFVPPTTQLQDGAVQNNDWSVETLCRLIDGILAQAEVTASGLAREITSLDDNLQMIELLHAQLLAKHPDAVIDIHKERLLTALMKQDYVRAGQIITDRIRQRDIGGFMFGSKSFYLAAQEYLESQFRVS